MKKTSPPTAKIPGPRRPAKITAAAARRQAARHVLKQMFTGAYVCAGYNARLQIYDPAGQILGGPVWVVYPNPVGKPAGLRAAEVIVVCQRTGRILYHGTTRDEG